MRLIHPVSTAFVMALLVGCGSTPSTAPTPTDVTDASDAGTDSMVDGAGLDAPPELDALVLDIGVDRPTIVDGSEGTDTTSPDGPALDAPLPDVAGDATPVDGARPGCSTAADCNDGVDCTDDLCTAGRCSHAVVPSRCAAGSSCDVRRGCQAGRACATTADCADTDPCTTNERCDSRSRVCLTDPLDGDDDGHPPRVCGGDDCDDVNPDVHPGSAERCNGSDDDCDGVVDGARATASCGAGFVCASGACRCEGATPLACGEHCVDPMTSHDNCGACGYSCGETGVCVGGACRCAAGQTLCADDGGCVDLMTDARNCGRCGNVCGSTSSCVAGTCRCRPGQSPCYGGAWRFRSEGGIGLDLATDGRGNVYLTGTVSGSANFGGAESSGTGSRPFLVSYTAEGSHRWSRTFPGTFVALPGSPQPRGAGQSLAVDASGNVFVTGGITTDTDFGGGLLVRTVGSTDDNMNDVFLASFTADGAHRWSHRYGTRGVEDHGTDVGVDTEGRVLLSGLTHSQIALGGPTVFVGQSMTAGIFRATLTSAGETTASTSYYWTRGQPEPRMVTSGREMCFGGTTNGSTSFIETYTGSASAGFVANGDRFTMTRFRGAVTSSWASVESIAADGAGNLFVTGALYGEIQVGTETLTSTEVPSIFVASFTVGGAPRWGRRFSSPDGAYGAIVAADAVGNVYLAAKAAGAIDLGGGSLPALSTTSDLIVASLTSTGTHRWSRRFRGARVSGGDVSPTVRSIAVGAPDMVYLTGQFTGTVDFGGGDLIGSSDIFLVRFMP